MDIAPEIMQEKLSMTSKLSRASSDPTASTMVAPMTIASQFTSIGNQYLADNFGPSLISPSTGIGHFPFMAGPFGSFIHGCVRLGLRDLAPHISLTDSEIGQKLKWLKKRHIVLWDVETKRGWLVGGVSALLHLARASLATSKTEISTSTFQRYKDGILESSVPYPKVAVEFFKGNNHQNLKLELQLYNS